MKKILKSGYFWVPVAILFIVFVVLYVRWKTCSDVSGKCSFWAGKPITTAIKRQASNDCCKDADGRTCYPCVSMKCCEDGFKAGYSENRDIIQRQKNK